MLDKGYLKKLSTMQFMEVWASRQSSLKLTELRLSRLKHTALLFPNWQAYQPLADQVVTISVYIEEQEAIKSELQNDIDSLEQFIKAKRQAELQRETPQKDDDIQVSLFDWKTPLKTSGCTQAQRVEAKG